MELDEDGGGSAGNWKEHKELVIQVMLMFLVN